MAEGQYAVMDAAVAVTTNRAGKAPGYNRAAARREALPFLEQSRFRIG